MKVRGLGMNGIMSNCFLLLIILGLITSCKGQIKLDSKGDQKERSSVGKIVSELDEKTLIMFQDSKDNYWFASQGVIRYDGNNLTQFTIEDGLYSNRIRGIQEDHLGNIYFDTGEGINKFDGQSIEKLELIQDSDIEWKLEPNDLWFEGSWNENGVYRYDGKKLYHLKFPKHRLEEEYNSLYPNSSFTPYDVR